MLALDDFWPHCVALINGRYLQIYKMPQLAFKFQH